MTTMLLMIAAGCRPELGDPNYPEREPFSAEDDPNFLDGIDPFEEGDERLSLGTFYEGPATESLEVNDETRFYNVYSQEYAPFNPTYTQADVADRVEGSVAAEITLNQPPEWMGGGINWLESNDVSEWTTLRIALKSTDPAFDTLQIRVEGGGTRAFVNAADWGFETDGLWHGLSIPLNEFTGVNFAQTTIPLELGLDAGGAGGSVLLVDDFYYSKED